MATTYSLTWSGDFNGQTAGANGKTGTLYSSNTLPNNAIVSSITYTVAITADNYSSTKYWNLYWLIIKNSDEKIGALISDSNGDAVESVKMSSKSGVISGSLNIKNTDVFQQSDLIMDCKANTTHSSTSYMRAVKVTVNYTLKSSLTTEEEAKQSCTIGTLSLNKTTFTAGDTSTTATLSWPNYVPTNDDAITSIVVGSPVNATIKGTSTINAKSYSSLTKFGSGKSVGSYSLPITVYTTLNDSGQIFYITIYITNPATIYPPSNIYIDKSGSTSSTNTIYYIGQLNRPSQITLLWTKSSDVGDNKITGYEYSTDKASWSTLSYSTSTTNTSLCYVNIATPSNSATDINYYIRAVGTYSNSASSTTYATISSITAPAMSSTPEKDSSSTLSSDVTVTATVTKPNNTSSLTYTVGYGGTTTTISPTINGSIYSYKSTINIANLTSGSTNIITLTAKAYCSDGSYTQNSYTFTITRQAALSSIIITKCGDANATTFNTLFFTESAYDNLTITWNSIKDSNGTYDVDYSVEYRISGTSSFTVFEDIGTSTENSITWTVSPNLQNSWIGKTLLFRIKGIYNKAIGYSLIKKIAILNIPTVSFSAIPTSSVNDKTINMSFNYGAIGDNNYSYDISINQTTNTNYSAYRQISSGILTSSSNANNIQNKIFSYDIKAEDLSATIYGSNSTNLYTGLYNLIVDGYGQPKGTVMIKVAYVKYPKCYNTITQSFAFDFRLNITLAATFTISYPHLNSDNQGYLNPGDNFNVLRLSKQTHEDSLGLSNTNITYSYKITGNSVNITKSEDVITSTSKTVFEAITPIQSTDTTLANDTTYTYTISTIATYADKVTKLASSTISALVYRWYDDGFNSSTSLNSATKKTIEIKIVLPSKQFTHSGENFKQLNLNAIVNNDDTLKISNQITSWPTNNTITAIITSSTALTDDLTVDIKLTIYNTSNCSFTSITSNFVRSDTIALSIRKGRVGINTAQNFAEPNNVGSLTTTGALTVFNEPGQESNPILLLHQDTSNIPFIKLTLANSRYTYITTLYSSVNSISIYSLAFVCTVSDDSNSTSYTYYLSAPKNALSTASTYNLLHNNSIINISQLSGVLPISKGGTGTANGGQAFYNLLSNCYSNWQYHLSYSNYYSYTDSVCSILTAMVSINNINNYTIHYSTSAPSSDGTYSIGDIWMCPGVTSRIIYSDTAPSSTNTGNIGDIWLCPATSTT